MHHADNTNRRVQPASPKQQRYAQTCRPQRQKKKKIILKQRPRMQNDAKKMEGAAGE
jgi:hypothetical protein